MADGPYRLDVTAPGGKLLGAVTILPDDPLVPDRHRGRIAAATGVLKFWRGWHARTFLRCYRKLGWRITQSK